MMDVLLAEEHLSKLREAGGNSAEMQMVCNTAMAWLRLLHTQDARIAELNQNLEDMRQATFTFASGVPA